MQTESNGAEALVLPTPIGPLTLVAERDALSGIYFPDDGRAGAARAVALAGRGTLLGEASAQLTAYFGGRARSFDLPLSLRGTVFQRAVWAELARIPFGQTRSYRDVARAIGRPDAIRAVGAANGRNPLSIVVPCHRVVGSDAWLTGYAGGLPAKAWLLAHEESARVP